MVDISGVATKNTEDQNTYNIEYNYTGTVTLAGGAAQEVASITLPSWFLASTTDDVTIGISSILGGQMLLASYEEGTSTTTDIKFRVGTNSGGAITAGDIRVNVLVRPN
jgi:hypothetical protein